MRAPRETFEIQSRPSVRRAVKPDLRRTVWIARPAPVHRHVRTHALAAVSDYPLVKELFSPSHEPFRPLDGRGDHTAALRFVQPPAKVFSLSKDPPDAPGQASPLKRKRTTIATAAVESAGPGSKHRSISLIDLYRPNSLDPNDTPGRARGSSLFSRPRQKPCGASVDPNDTPITDAGSNPPGGFWRQGCDLS